MSSSLFRMKARRGYSRITRPPTSIEIYKKISSLYSELLLQFFRNSLINYL